MPDVYFDPLDLVLRFNAALNRADVDGMMAEMSADCVFENTSPAPDGRRFHGQAAVRAFWEEFFRSSASAQIDVEEIFASGERCVMRWIYHWTGGDGSRGYIRGVDIYRFQAGKICEKLSYVKG